MNLYLVRHGEAGNVGGTITRDAERPLTPRGEEDARLIGSALALLDGGISQILSSPLLRAMKTAQIIASCIPGNPPVISSGTLAPGLQPRSLLADLKGAAPVQGMMIVGHQPDMSELIAFLVADGSYAEIAFPPGAAAKLTLEPGADPPDARLHWLFSPDVVRRLSART